MKATLGTLTLSSNGYPFTSGTIDALHSSSLSLLSRPCSFVELYSGAGGMAGGASGSEVI